MLPTIYQICKLIGTTRGYIHYTKNSISQVLQYQRKLKWPSKYHLFNSFLAVEETVFPIAKNFKTKIFQESVNAIFLLTFWFKKDLISHPRTVQNKNFSVISKYHISINFLAREKTVFFISENVKKKNFLVTSKHVFSC